MSEVKIIRADREGNLEGVRVIAIHGHLHPTETPARGGPVYVDADYNMLRIVETHAAPHGFDVVVETASPPLPETGELPGHATRLGPWQARLEHQVIVLGPSEIQRADRLTHRSVLAEPPSVERFVRWLLIGRDPDSELRCERIKGVAVWYCSKPEGFALFERVHATVQDEYYGAARRFQDGCPGAARQLEDASWWLSRAATSDTDIYRAAAGLRRAGSADWQLMLRQGLHLKDEKDWALGLRDAEHLLKDPPTPAHVSSKIGSKLAHDRAFVRGGFKSPEPGADESGKRAEAA